MDSLMPYHSNIETTERKAEEREKNSIPWLQIAFEKNWISR